MGNTKYVFGGLTSRKIRSLSWLISFRGVSDDGDQKQTYFFFGLRQVLSDFEMVVKTVKRFESCCRFSFFVLAASSIWQHLTTAVNVRFVPHTNSTFRERF
jgi:hypothetical protein